MFEITQPRPGHLYEVQVTCQFRELSSRSLRINRLSRQKPENQEVQLYTIVYTLVPAQSHNVYMTEKMYGAGN